MAEPLRSFDRRGTRYNQPNQFGVGRMFRLGASASGFAQRGWTNPPLPTAHFKRLVSTRLRKLMLPAASGKPSVNTRKHCVNTESRDQHLERCMFGGTGIRPVRESRVLQTTVGVRLHRRPWPQAKSGYKIKTRLGTSSWMLPSKRKRTKHDKLWPQSCTCGQGGRTPDVT